MVKPMSLLKLFVGRGAIQQAVTRVEQPNCHKHRDRDHRRKGNSGGMGHEPCPHCSYRRSIK